LKAVEAEELFDLFLYRPLGWPLVLALIPTPITPNQVTLVTFLVTVAAGVLYWQASTTFIMLGGVAYFVSRVLDCVDGQLARARGGGSKLGKLYDGLSDYVGHVAVFIGLGFAFGRGDLSHEVSLFGWFSLPVWIWAFIAGFSLIYQCILADKYKNEYLTRKFPDRKPPEEELRELEMERDEASGIEKLLLRIFTAYLRLQNWPSDGEGEEPSEDETARKLYCKSNRWPLFAWNLLGPSMHANLIVIFSLMGRVDLYIPTVFLIMNLATVPLHLMQWLVNRSVRGKIAAMQSS
jgi:hypothetical protein